MAKASGLAYVPPPAMVALISESNSSSPRIASCKWRGVIRFTLRSLEALPASSSTYKAPGGDSASGGEGSEGQCGPIRVRKIPEVPGHDRHGN